MITAADIQRLRGELSPQEQRELELIKGVYSDRHDKPERMNKYLEVVSEMFNQPKAQHQIKYLASTVAFIAALALVEWSMS